MTNNETTVMGADVPDGLVQVNENSLPENGNGIGVLVQCGLTGHMHDKLHSCDSYQYNGFGILLATKCCAKCTFGVC